MLDSFGTSGSVIIASLLSSTDVERGKSVPAPMAGEARPVAFRPSRPLQACLRWREGTAC
jgi:hypothetical protein